MLRVIHIASGDLWAGAEAQLFNLCRGLLARDDLTLKVILMNEGQLADNLRSSGVDVSVISESGSSLFSLMRRVWAVVKGFRPAIIHSHRQKEHLLGAFCALRLADCRSLRTMHSAPFYNDSSLPLSQQMIWGLDRLVGRWLQRKIIAVSGELGEQLQLHFEHNKLCVIENCIDFTTLEQRANEPIPFMLTGDTVNIGLIGRLVEIKRIDRFIQIAKLVQQRAPGKFKFFLVGDGPMEQELRDQIVADHLLDVVEMTGFCPNPLPLLRVLDMLYITSDHEGLPMTLLETIALATPFVSSAVGGIPAVARGLDCGELLSADDIEGFVEHALAYRDNQEYFEGRARAGRELALRRYSADIKAEQHVALYRQLALE